MTNERANFIKSLQIELESLLPLTVAMFILSIALYFATEKSSSFFALSREMLIIGEKRIPYASFAGVSAAVSNTILILIVVSFGKIGVSDTIINKPGKLTDEEFTKIKKHPVWGWEILSNITDSPYLSVGAHYHHEKYDGHGYPEGLSGKNIPDMARIIAVADAYDAMTSKRSYRSPLPQEVVRSEIENGSGSQFDPVYAKIMLDMIDEDKN